MRGRVVLESDEVRRAPALRELALQCLQERGAGRGRGADRAGRSRASVAQRRGFGPRARIGSLRQAHGCAGAGSPCVRSWNGLASGRACSFDARGGSGVPARGRCRCRRSGAAIYFDGDRDFAQHGISKQKSRRLLPAARDREEAPRRGGGGRRDAHSGAGLAGRGTTTTSPAYVRRVEARLSSCGNENGRRALADRGFSKSQTAGRCQEGSEVLLIRARCFVTRMEHRAAMRNPGNRVPDYAPSALSSGLRPPLERVQFSPLQRATSQPG